jgi:hypothetical protein
MPVAHQLHYYSARPFIFTESLYLPIVALLCYLHFTADFNRAAPVVFYSSIPTKSIYSIMPN